VPPVFGFCPFFRSTVGNATVYAKKCLKLPSGPPLEDGLNNLENEWVAELKKRAMRGGRLGFDVQGGSLK
jgi:hypothetical protein